MKSKKILSLVLAAAASLAALSGCGKADEATSSGDYSKKFTYTMLVNIDEDAMAQSASWKYIQEKFNVDIEPYYVSDADAGEKARIWMATGDMPDIMRWGMGTQYDQFLDWVEQGLLRELPDLSKWTYLQQQQDSAKITPYTIVDGKRYAWVVTKQYDPNEGEGEGSSYSFFYRRDMAKELGLYKEDDTYTWDEFVNLAKAMRDANASDTAFIPWGMPKALYPYGTGLMMYSPYWEQYYFNPETEKYEWAMDKEETTEAILFANKMFKEKVFSKDQAIFNGNEAVDKFKIGKCGILMHNCANFNTRDIYTNFKATTGKNPEECIGIARVYAPDGKAWGQYGMNYTHLILFKPDLSDEKMARLMDIYDWCLSPEGLDICRWGIEGIDHKIVDGKKEMINEDGSLNGANPFWAKAPVATFPADPDEEAKLYGQYILDQYEEFKKWHKANDENFRRYDFTQFFCTGEAYATHGAYFYDGSDLIKRLMPSMESEEKIIAEWNSWKDSVRPNVEKVIAELNAAYQAEKAAE